MPEDLNHIGYHPDPPTTAQYRGVTFGSGAPTGTGWEGQPYFDEDTGDLYFYQSGTWTLASSGGGGGGGDQYVFSGNYGGGTPTDTPTVAQAVGIDTSDGTKWYWYSGSWH